MTSHIDASRNGFNLAFQRAQNSSLSGFTFNIDLDAQFTGVDLPPNSKKSILRIAYADPLVYWLVKRGIDTESSWLMILAHESGHLRLNSICQANGADPSNPDAQLAAIGFAHELYSSFSTSGFQKETAIESFCDACAGNAAAALLGRPWEKCVEALREYRSDNSNALGLFKGDQYATLPALNELIRRKGNLDPKEAALISFKDSIEKIAF